jgi:hypothetical protein
MKTKLLLLASAVLFCCIGQGLAQPMPSAKISAVAQVSQTVEFSVMADEPFYFGGNRHVLYIGSRPFTIARQSDADGKGLLTFLIPAGEFNVLPEGGKIYLSYGEIGNMDESGSPADEMASSMPKTCKYLGVFTKKMLGQ